MDNPTHLIVCVSGGKDSITALLKTLETYPGVPITVHHQRIPEDWPGTVEYIANICQRLNVPLVVEQAHYYGFRCAVCEGTYLSGTPDKGQGKCPVVLSKLPNGKQVRCNQIAQGSQIAEVRGLLDLMNWRSKWPSKSIRFCTSYLKRDLFNKYARRQRETFGINPVMVTGERWAESLDRAKLPHLETRDSLTWLTEWRPILALRRIDVFNALKTASIEPHPCYSLQGMTAKDMYETDIEGGPRMSCVCCFFNSASQLAINAQLNPALFDIILEFEERTGHTVKSGLSMKTIIEAVK